MTSGTNFVCARAWAELAAEDLLGGDREERRAVDAARILSLEGVAVGVLREIGFFDIYPADDAAEFNGAWSVCPFLASGNIVLSGIEQGLFVVAIAK